MIQPCVFSVSIPNHRTVSDSLPWDCRATGFATHAFAETASLRSEIDLQHLPRDYAVLYIDDDGIPQVKVSPSIQGREQEIFGPDVVNRFISVVHGQQNKWITSMCIIEISISRSQSEVLTPTEKY